MIESNVCSTAMSIDDRKVNNDFIINYSLDPGLKSCYKIFNPSQVVNPYTCLNKEVYESCAHELSKKENCMGIITQNNETIILNCDGNVDKLSSTRNCFKIYTIDGNVHVACKEKVEERCVGIRTPSNLTVLLDCYYCFKPNTTIKYTKYDDIDKNRKYRHFVKSYMDKEYKRENSYLKTIIFEVFNQNDFIEPPGCPYCLKGSREFYAYWLPNTDCYGLTLNSNETIILECISKQKDVKPGCFLVNNSKQEKTTVCIRPLDEVCVGVITPRNLSVVLACYPPKTCRSCGFLRNRWHLFFYDGFSPKLGNCYDIYDQNETVTSFICQRQANLENQYCIKWIPGNKFCLGLSTPTNETVEFICKDKPEQLLSSYYNPNKCFKVYNVDKTFKTVCQKNFDDDYSIGITTPDNFTILFESHFCNTSISIKERKMFNDFINNYSFDPELKNCYKVFNPNQTVSPYTCLNRDVHDYCVHELRRYENCTGIVTQNNETIILDCAKNGEKSSSTRNCFKIYTSDGNEHVACQKKIEERCVGIITPTNLTLLLDCYYCYRSNGITNSGKPDDKYRKFDDDKNKKYRQFVKSYLEKEYKREHSYLDQIIFEVFDQNDFVKPPNCPEVESGGPSRQEFYAYWLPNTNCYGVTLKTNETVILECTSSENKVEPGCFQIVNSEQENTSVCIRPLDEICVGIITPRNLSLVFACYPEYTCKPNWRDSVGALYAKKSPDNHRFNPRLHTCYEVYSKNHEVGPHNCEKKAQEKYSCIDWISDNCLGLTTPQNETIELLCGSINNAESYDFTTISPCFNVYSQEGNVEKVCQRKFGNLSIGITTPKNDSILFYSYFCHTYKTVQELKTFKEFIQNFNFDPDVKSCYKIFMQDQEISPQSCFHKDAYQTCIQQINGTNCTGIKTQHNEIVILHCPDDNRKNKKSGCFEIYTPDNKVHSSCQRKLEESCIGISTPSNLSVLFECHSCQSTKGYLPAYFNPVRKEMRRFIDRTLQRYTQGNYFIKNSYEVVTDKGSKVSEEEKKVHLLRGHGNCLGLTLKNFETVVLDCPNKTYKKNGCFNVYSSKSEKIRNSPEQKIQNVCVTVLEERCIGIITPNNWIITMGCFSPGGGSAGRVSYYMGNIRRNGRPHRM